MRATCGHHVLPSIASHVRALCALPAQVTADFSRLLSAEHGGRIGPYWLNMTMDQLRRVGTNEDLQQHDWDTIWQSGNKEVRCKKLSARLWFDTSALSLTAAASSTSCA
jgi:hypothetical protein